MTAFPSRWSPTGRLLRLCGCIIRMTGGRCSSTGRHEIRNETTPERLGRDDRPCCQRLLGCVHFAMWQGHPGKLAGAARSFTFLCWYRMGHATATRACSVLVQIGRASPWVAPAAVSRCISIAAPPPPAPCCSQLQSQRESMPCGAFVTKAVHAGFKLLTQLRHRRLARPCLFIRAGAAAPRSPPHAAPPAAPQAPRTGTGSCTTQPAAQGMGGDDWPPCERGLARVAT